MNGPYPHAEHGPFGCGRLYPFTMCAHCHHDCAWLHAGTNETVRAAFQHGNALRKLRYIVTGLGKGDFIPTLTVHWFGNYKLQDLIHAANAYRVFAQQFQVLSHWSTLQPCVAMSYHTHIVTVQHFTAVYSMLAGVGAYTHFVKHDILHAQLH